MAVTSSILLALEGIQPEPRGMFRVDCVVVHLKVNVRTLGCGIVIKVELEEVCVPRSHLMAATV